MTISLTRLTSYQPRLNLPEKTSSRRKETYLLFSFLRWYQNYLFLKKPKRKHTFFREIELNGYGIADLMMFEYSNGRNRTKNQISSGYITTFELKIRDWKKALKQAIRYKYYSNRVIVILPRENVNTAKLNRKIFAELNVGLWAFDKKENRLEKIFTPRFHKPLNIRSKEKVLYLISSKTKSL